MGLLLLCVWAKQTNRITVFYIKYFSSMSHIVEPFLLFLNLEIEKSALHSLFLTPDVYFQSVRHFYLNEVFDLFLLPLSFLSSSSAADWPPHVAGIVLYSYYLMVYWKSRFLLSCLLSFNDTHTQGCSDYRG